MKRWLFLLMFLLLIASALAVNTDVDFDSGEVEVVVILKEKPVKEIKKFQTMAMSDEIKAKKEFLKERRASVKENQDKVLNRLNKGFRIQSAENKFKRFSTINGFTGKISKEEFEKLKNDPNVEGIYKNRQFSVSLNDSILLVNSSRVNAMVQNYTHNLTGSGQTVCVIDTGIEYNHTYLGAGWGNKVLAGYDYENSDTDPIDDHGHGTHVAGIIASTHPVYTGVAPGANLVALKACDSSGNCDGTAMLSSIDWCNNNSVAYNITVISMSIGDKQSHNSSDCPTTFDSAINTAVGLGITFVVASGNEGYKTGINLPACSPNATSVGATTKADGVWSSTNSVDILDVFAPGASIRSTYIGNTIASISGTSMATPHVSGLVAILNQYNKLINNQTYNSSAIETILKTNGVNITDGGNGLSFPRIKAYASILAEDSVSPSGSFILPSVNNTNTSLNSVTVKFNASESVNATLQFNNTNYTMSLVSDAVYQKVLTDLVKANYTYLIYLTDYAGNNYTSAEYTVTVNNSAPVIASYVPNASNASVVEQGSLFFNHSSSDPEGDSLSYYWYLNGSLQSNNVSWNFTPGCTDHGDYNLTLVVSDGSINASNSWDLEVNDTNCAPVAYILSPSNGSLIEFRNSQAFTTNSSDGDGDTLNYTWDFDDGTIVNDTNTTHNYTAVGLYNVTLTVNDSSLASDYTIWVNVSDTTAPVISNPYPSDGSELGSSTTSTTISVDTDENATCRYQTSSTVNFTSATNFTTTGGTSHSSSISVSSGSSYNYYIKCNDSFGNVNAGDYHFDFSVASTSSGGTSGSSSGGSTTSSSTPGAKKSFYYTTMTIGTKYDFGFSGTAVPFSEMSFSPKENLNSVDVTVQVITEPPKTLSNAYKYVQITLKNIDDTQISSPYIKFKVNKTWISSGSYDPAKVSLHRYENGAWKKLTTKQTSDDSNYYHYYADVPGFSYYSITAEKKETVTAPAAVTETPAPETFAVQDDSVPKPQAIDGAAATEEPVENDREEIWYLLLLIPAAALILGIVIYFTKFKKPPNLGVVKKIETVKKAEPAKPFGEKKGEILDHLISEVREKLKEEPEEQETKNQDNSNSI